MTWSKFNKGAAYSSPQSDSSISLRPKIEINFLNWLGKKIMRKLKLGMHIISTFYKKLLESDEKIEIDRIRRECIYYGYIIRNCWNQFPYIVGMDILWDAYLCDKSEINFLDWLGTRNNFVVGINIEWNMDGDGNGYL